MKTIAALYLAVLVLISPSVFAQEDSDIPVVETPTVVEITPVPTEQPQETPVYRNPGEDPNYRPNDPRYPYDPFAPVVDEDGDGWSATINDCNDSDNRIFPVAIDPVGDGIDQDCDGFDGGTGSLTFEENDAWANYVYTGVYERSFAGDGSNQAYGFIAPEGTEFSVRVTGGMPVQQVRVELTEAEIKVFSSQAFTEDLPQIAIEFALSELDLSSLPESNTLIASSQDGTIRLYRLTTGEFQINVPTVEDENGFVIIW